MAASTPINYLIFFFGLALIVVGLVGGGVEIKEIKIPTLPIIPRVLVLLLGAVLAGASIWAPQFFEGNPPNQKVADATQNPGPVPVTHDVSIAILFTPDKRSLASEMRQYLAGIGYESVALCDDFSEIKESDHEKAGTVRIVYNSNEPVAGQIADALRGRFPSDIARLVQSPNERATAANVQIQVWGVPSSCGA